MDLYTPTRIEEVFRRSPRVTTFLKSTFFKGSKTFVTQSVNFDIVEGSRSVAPFVNPKAGGQVIPNKGYSTKTYTAPLVSPEKVTEAEEMLNRIAGEQITSSMTPAERAVRKLSEDLVEMDEMITRREEVMCAEALFTGKITVKGKNIDDEIDFGFSNTETLSKKWSAAGSDPIHRQDHCKGQEHRRRDRLRFQQHRNPFKEVVRCGFRPYRRSPEVEESDLKGRLC